MEVLKWDSEHPDVRVLRAAAEVVLRGGVIAFPTDTLYGLGCSLFDVEAVLMVARIKRRDPSLAVISLIPEPRQAYGLSSEVTPGKTLKSATRTVSVSSTSCSAKCFASRSIILSVEERSPPLRLSVQLSATAFNPGMNVPIIRFRERIERPARPLVPGWT